MKTSLPALFFLFALVTRLLPSAAVGLVRDIEGNPVINNGGPYYLLGFGSNGAGLKTARTGNDACALSVVQAPSQNEGMPLRISSTNPRPISTDELVNMEFDGITPSHWVVREGYVKVGSHNESPKGSFEIRQYETYRAYNILYCPPESDSDDACRYVKIVTDEDNNNLLALANADDSKYSRLAVQFKKKDVARGMQGCICTCPHISMV